jgi:hypothetical protein
MELVFGTVYKVTFGRRSDEGSGKYRMLHENKLVIYTLLLLLQLLRQGS